VVNLLGNYVFYNRKPTIFRQGTYTFNGDSSINIVLPVMKKKLDSDFIILCSLYSKLVQQKKTESFTRTLKQQLFDLLSSTTDHVKTLILFDAKNMTFGRAAIQQIFLFIEFCPCALFRLQHSI
jgi:hypothetical protein